MVQCGRFRVTLSGAECPSFSTRKTLRRRGLWLTMMAQVQEQKCYPASNHAAMLLALLRNCLQEGKLRPTRQVATNEPTSQTGTHDPLHLVAEQPKLRLSRAMCFSSAGIA